MYVAFPVRVIITSSISIFLIVIPRVLQFFGLDNVVLDEITSAWATFTFLLIAIGIFLYPWLKNKRFFLPIIVLILLVAFGLTFYFCDLALPW